MIKIDNLKQHIILKTITNPRLRRGFFRLKRITLAFTVLAALYFVSCNKELDTIGLDLLDNKLKISIDTILPVSSFTQMEDSVPTSIASGMLSKSMLGYYSDPVFGKTLASIYTEALPPVIPFSIAGTNAPSALTVDSVVLSLAYIDYFGDITSELTVKVYELEDTVPGGTVYSNNVLAYKSELLHQSSFIPNPTDTVYFYTAKDTTSLPPHLRLNLDHSLGRRFIDGKEETADFSTNNEYRAFFKGLYITVEETDGTGAMLSFSLQSALSRIQIFYKIDNDTVPKNFVLNLSDQLARKYTHFENFEHQYASQDIKDQALQGDTLAGQERIFVQSMANFRSQIVLPDPQTFIDFSGGDIAINSARLIIPVDSEFLQDTLAIAKALLLLRGGEEEGEFFTLQDQAVGVAYHGGPLNEEKMEYSFNITQHLQLVMMGALPNYPLYLRVSGSMENAGRAVLKGPMRENGLRLEIKYTEPIQ